MPAAGALVAAIIGGLLWAVIAITTEYEIGLIAWAIGGLAGYAVAIFSGRQAGRTHQIIAVIAALLGILIGKYVAFSYYLTETFDGIVDAEIMAIFQQNIGEFFGGMDIIFVLLAVVTAWQLPEKLSSQPQPQPQPIPSEQTSSAE
jgi:hypothetical protein